MILRTKDDARELAKTVGGISQTNKMPCHSYSLPAEECTTGAELAKIAGTPCSVCYAMRNRYRMPKNKAAAYVRFGSIGTAGWVDTMASVIRRLEDPQVGSGFFRWHDSGDLQGVGHLSDIVDVADLTPTVLHWLPTREVGILRDWDSGLPANLTVRVSAPRIDGMATNVLGLPSSTVVSDSARATCRAFERKGKCGDCRDCWNPNIRNVSYFQH